MPAAKSSYFISVLYKHVLFFTKQMFLNREYIHHQIYFYLLILIAVSLPFTVRLNSFFVILLAINWLIEGGYKLKFSRLQSNTLAKLSIGFYLFHIIGLAYTSDLQPGLSDVETKLSLFVFPLIISSTQLLTKQQFEYLLKWFVAACLLAITICFGHAFYQYFVNHTTEYFYYHALSGAIEIHAIYLAMYLNFSIGILIYFLSRRGNKMPVQHRLMYLAFILFFSIGIFFLASKIIIICFFLFCNVFVARLFFIKYGLVSSVAFTTLINISILILLLNIPYTKERFLVEKDLNFDFMEKNEYDREYSGLVLRVVLWKFTVDILNAQQGWILGVGTGDGQHLLDQSYRTHGMYTGNINFNDHGYLGYNTHNQYVQFLLSLGILGLLYFLLILGLSSIQAIQHKNYLYLYFLLLFALSAVSEANLCTQKGVVFYAFFHSLFAANYVRSESGFQVY
jgi:O-antigen ligase